MSKGELAFVDWLQAACTVDAARVPIGIGDDMALVALDGRLVLATADMLLDGVHFETARQPLESIGRKAIACSLSDCAAMACRPRGAMVSVALPNSMSMEDAQRLYNGMLAIGREFDCPIIGGDTTSWDHPLAIDVSMIGEPMSKRGPIRRDGASAGDILAVTGPLGGSLAGKHLDFTPRLADAEFLVNEAGDFVHAMMDITDGLAIDTFRICRASRCSARFDAKQLDAVASAAAREAARPDGRPAADHVLNDGEDFELLICIQRDGLARLDRAPNPITIVGEIVPQSPNAGAELLVRHADGRTERIEPKGYEHFRQVARMSATVQLESDSPEATKMIGRALGAAIRKGDVIALIGPLGAGKTVLVKGIAAGAGVADPRRVTSPTFVIVNEYDGRLHLYHIDAYRLGGGRELEALGMDEFAEQGAVIVEWADRVQAALPAEKLTIRIDPIGEQRRTLHISVESGATGLLQAVQSFLSPPPTAGSGR